MQIKITTGSMSLEYDGDENFFRDEVGKFLERFTAQAAKAPSIAATTVGGQQTPTPKGGVNHSTNTVAKLLNAQTGPDLIMAAVAKIIIVDGKDTADRATITAEMKKATSYYKKTYTSNLSNSLDNLTKADSLRLVAENVYGLPAKMRETLEPKLHEQ
jgi:hypothetical protein